MKKIVAMFMILILTVGMLTGCGGGDDKGAVYYLNFKPEADGEWQELARKYTELTGVEVKVITAASGNYAETLTAEMGKSAAPTLFQCSRQSELDVWEDYCYDLSNTAFARELTSNDFNLYGKNGELFCVGYCYEAFGIITNKELLEEAGYEVEDIQNFADLKRIAEDITKRSKELGFAAFTSSGLDASSEWRFSGHLANMPLFYEFRDNGVTQQPEAITGAYLDNYKQIWDLYIQNVTCKPSELATKTGDEAEAEFGREEAVFYQNGSWEYSRLVEIYDMDPEDLTMIPIYCGVPGEENAGLCYGTENRFAVNKKASQEDIDATLDFLYWLVTSDEGTTMLAEEFGPIPFENAKETENVFFADTNNMLHDGKYLVGWVFSHTPNVAAWRAAVTSALLQYSTGNGSWEDVETAFVDGWAIQYRAQ